MNRNRSSYENARKFKISIIGDMGTGKTCLSLRFVKGLFSETYKATITDIETKCVDIKGNCVVFQIWDTAGQERFRSLLPLYMKGIDGAVIVYDITSKVTYDHVNLWLSEIRKYADNNTVIMVAGNKKDLIQDDDSRKEVSTAEVRSWCRFHDIIFYEASAKTGENVNEMFLALGEAMLLKTKEETSQYICQDSSITGSGGKHKTCC